MRIAVVVQGFGYGRGRATTMVELAAPLARAGHQVEAFTTAVRPGPDVAGIPVHRFSALDTRRRYDVVIFNSGMPGHVLDVLRKLPTRRLMCQHSYNHADPGLRLAHTVWFPSRAAAGVHHGSYAKLVSPPPIDPDRYRVNPGDRVTLSLSSPHKGGVLTAAVARALPHVGFLVVKDPRGHGVRLFQGLANVELRDFMEPRDFYAATRVQLFPSKSETYGRVAVEGAISGIPVVASTHRGIREAMDGHGIFLDRTDTRAWVRAVDRLMTDPDHWAAASRDVQVRGDAVRYEHDGATFRRAVEAMR